MSNLIVDYLVSQLRNAAKYNENVQVAPAAVLWTDITSQWQSAMPVIKQYLPELIELGEYDADNRTGPAIWIKCAISNKLEELNLPQDRTPIIYLPGVGRKDLRAIEICPEHLQPLAELQYRGCWWAYNTAGRDWSVSSFLSNEKVGVNLNIAQDGKTQDAMQLVLSDLLLEKPENLRDRKLEANDFNGLVADDPIKDLLAWLNDAEAVKSQWSTQKWQVFTSQCQQEWGFDVTSSSSKTIASLLCSQEGNWNLVWQRFSDTTALYPKLISQLEAVKPLDLAYDASAYLSLNLEDEKQLEVDLSQLKGLMPAEARTKIYNLFAQHKERLDWLWFKLGYSPFVAILAELDVVAQYTKQSFTGPDVETMANAYKQSFWQADASALKAMALTKNDSERALVAGVLAVIYTPWLNDVAQNFQGLVQQQGYPGLPSNQGGKISEASANYQAQSQVVFFVDGLRYDVAHSLVEKLKSSAKVELKSHWSALPSLTATAKAAVTPVNHLLTGLVENDNFIPVLADGEQDFSSHHFKKKLAEQGWQYLEDLQTGDVNGMAWLQTGDLDKTGHKEELKLPLRIDDILNDVVDRVQGLLESGWQHIRIVTDHGWLWVPDQLPKAEINKNMCKKQLVRCAILKDNVATEHLKMHWHWNENVTIAMAPGISGFTAGKYYEHGGVSLQECLTPMLDITAN